MVLSRHLSLSAARQTLLRRAAAKKEGWGWGVNNGDIWVLRAVVEVLLWAEDLAEVAEEARARASISTLESTRPNISESHSETPEH